MFRFWLALIGLLATMSSVRACDACGCSILFLDMGITPRYTAHQVGLRWQNQRFRSYASAADRTAGLIGSEETFLQLDLQAQIVLHARWRLQAQLPYTWLQRTVDGVTTQQNGLNDGSLLVQFVALNTENSERDQLRHRLTVGLGAKAPLGAGQKASDELPTANPNFQLGSGTWDALGFVQYVGRLQAWGLAADVLATRNGTNDQEYQYGHRMSSHLQLFRVISMGKSGWMPSVGAYWEQAQQDVQHGYYRSDTGGQNLFAKVGLQLYRPNWSMPLQWQQPVRNDWADGLVESRSRLSVQGSWYF
jgi:hypothetical protein